MTQLDSDTLLKNINGALKSKKLYPAGHPATIAPARKAYQFVTEFLKTKNTLAIGRVNDLLVFESSPVADSDRLYPELSLYMAEKNVDALLFEKGVTERELSALFEILSGEQIQGPSLQKELHAKGVTHVTLKSMSMGRRNMLEIYNGAVECVKNVMNEVRMGKIPKSEPVESIVDEMTESVLSDQSAMLGLTMIKNYDNYLYNHSVNVSILSLSLARAMDLTKEDIHTLGVAALLHDIGKTGVSEKIIRKPGGLSSEEWDKIKEHPLLGSNITKRMDGLDDKVSRIIYEHHIKYDRSGYPQTADELHPLSLIITIFDAYDALTTLRVYQRPHDPVEAVKILQNFSGRYFNPNIIKAFINMVGVYPVGTMVRLSTDEIGIITKTDSASSTAPVVKVVYDKDGAALDPPYEMDLSSEEGKDKSILATVNPATVNVDIAAFFERQAG